MRRRTLPLLAVLAAAAAITATATSTAATSPPQACSSYRIDSHTAGKTLTWHLYRLRATNVSCRSVRNVMHGRLFDRNRNLTTCPPGGVPVGAWQVVLCGGRVRGVHDEQSFRGRFSLYVH